MSGKKLSKLVNRKSIFGFAVPIGICVASSFFNLKPVFQQALVGITLIWLEVGILSGFGIWQ